MRSVSLGVPEVLRRIERARGFSLLPVDLPGPEVARALAEAIREAGRPVTVIEPGDEAAWRGLAEALCAHEVEPRGVVVVIGPADPEAAREGLSRLDARCDAIVERLGGPLLWCGPASFLAVSGEAAPDFWSEAKAVIKVGAAAPAVAVAALSLGEARPGPEARTAELPLPSIEASRVRVFYSYADADKTLCQRLEDHLTALRRSGAIADWYSGKVGAGGDWEQETEAQLHAADVILLLVSADFLRWKDAEMDRAIARHKAGEARVIPVLVRPCDWAVAGLSGLSPLPDDGVAVTSTKRPRAS